MARSFLLITTIVKLFFCAGTANIDSINDNIHDPASSPQLNGIVIDNVNDYLQGQEKRLATLKKHIEDYSKEHKRAEGKLVQYLSGAKQESSGSDRKKIESETYEGKLKEFQSTMKKYGELCGGEILIPTGIQKKLKCRYTDRGIPFLKIAPFKEEEAYLDPRIVLYHDVLYEEEIEVFKGLVWPRLKSAQVINTTSGQSRDSDGRIAKNGWLYEAENELVKLLSRRVEHMTKLTVETGENLAIAYYEVGGIYLPHFDYIPAKELKLYGYFTERGIGNRIATALFYMNDVEEGGATVFTELDLTIWPKKGSALFWHNLKRNGETNPLTKHGACKVLSGTKWIATKWLHEIGQEFIRPCSLSESE